MGLINSGVKQWIFQRIANALFVTFGIFLLCIFLNSDGLSYAALQSQLVSWKWYLAIVLVFACINGVLAGWQIDGDYAKKFGLPRLAITVIALLVGGFYLVSGLQTLLIL